MKLYRIERKKYLNTTLSGISASRSKGFRWNSEETKLVYTSESRALAVLEVSVHLDISQDIPDDRCLVEIEIPNNILALEVNASDLPKNWDSKPPISITQIIGDDFVKNNDAAILKVPSCIIPQEYNYLINPLHTDAQKIKIVHQRPLKFDDRLSK